METLLLGASSLAIVNKVGFDIIVGTLTTTTKSIGAGIAYLTSMDQPGFKEAAEELRKIDLEFMTSVIEELVKEQSTNVGTGSVNKALEGVNGVLEDIESELSIIKKAVEQHQTKYFNSWRVFDCSVNVEKIKKQKEILDNRYKVLTDLLKIYRSNVQTNLNTIQNKKEEKERQTLEQREELLV